jgi:hypothetical protein
MHNAADHQVAAKSRRPQWEVADVFRAHGSDYRQQHSLPRVHLRVMRAIETCRTAALGGHVEKCDHCGFERISYNSCRNRHCPKCQSLAKARWMENRKAELLPVGYFHSVFTLPHELNPLVLCNKKTLFDILFKAVSDTLLEFGADPKHGLGGKLGCIAILHTWDQTLQDHFHLHCLIPGGALSSDGSSWTHARKNYLFSVKALSKAFRGKFIHLLKKAFKENRLIFPGKASSLASTRMFVRLLNQLWKKQWVVYSKKPFAGPENVLDYLGRYTHRVAITNHRITAVENGVVRFRYRDRRDHEKFKFMTLAAEEFIRRFLLHTLPDSYVRIRLFGFLANKCKERCLALCRKALHYNPEPPNSSPIDSRSLLLHLTGIDLDRCPRCSQGTMYSVKILPLDTTFAPNPMDSS